MAYCSLILRHCYWATHTADCCLMTDWPLRVRRTYTHAYGVGTASAIKRSGAEPK